MTFVYILQYIVVLHYLLLVIVFSWPMLALTPDQYRFLMANVAGLSLALPYRYIPKSFRNEFNYLPGILMLYYCFGSQANTLLAFSAISYAICKLTPQQYVQRVTMCSSLAFLSYAHLSRQILDYGGYVLDISGPFMIAVQKMTSLGFCLYDGKVKKQKVNQKLDSADNNNNTSNNNDDINFNVRPNSPKVKSSESIGSESSVIGATINTTQTLPRRDSKSQIMTDEQRKYAVPSAPSFNEFMGYFFHFPSVLCGPIMYFNDYSDFVNSPEGKEHPPGKAKAVAKKLTISVSCAVLHLALNPKFEIEFLRSPEFLVHTPIALRFYYILIFTVLSRLKYYVAWHLGEAISNASGLGFSGYDFKGRPTWNLISNMNLWKFETSLNLRDAIHAWNQTTQTWLRRTAYERAPRKLSVLATYLLSAVWHGFYPGYYMTFLGGALFTHAARNGRRLIRPRFQRGKILPKIYDAITFILTRLTIAYVAFPFVILDFRNNYEIYKSLYFSLHIFALGGVFLGIVFRRK